MKLFNKKNQDEIMYQTGYDDAEKKLIPEWKAKLDDLDNQKNEVIDDLNFKIMRLEIQLKNWKSDHEKGIQKQIEAKKQLSNINKEWNKIDQFKKEVLDKMKTRLAKNNEEDQDILILLGDTEYKPDKQIEN